MSSQYMTPWKSAKTSWWGIMMTALRVSSIGEGTGSREAAVFGMMASMVWDQKVGVEQLAGI